MKNNTQRKTINVDKHNLMPLWTFKQEDDVVLNLSLFKESTPFNIAGQTIRLGAKTSKGLKEQIDGFTIQGNDLDIALKNTILVPGVVEIDLEFTDAGGKMTSASFFININSKVLNASAIKATNEFDTFTKTVEEIEKDYQGLRKIVIDENNAANLQDQVNKTISSLEQMATQIIDCCYFGASPNNSDNTSIIQSCLDKKGKVVITKAGIYNVRGLVIDDNTDFELYDGVELKLIDNSKQYIIRNKYANDGTLNRNKNIKVSGFFNQNGTMGNGSAGSIQQKLYNGHSMFFHKVDGLDVKKVKVKDSIKYAIFIVDATRVNVKDINFDTLSDGIHFQPPINNAIIENITGTTHDDMVAFTLGDYTEHSLSNVGDFENIKINGVNANGSLCILKITGSGLNSSYKFKNFDVKNLYGETISSVIKITDDTTEGNTDLINTKVYSFNFENIYARSRTTHDIFIGATDGDVSFKNVPYKSLIDTKAVFRCEKVLRCLKIEGVIGYDADIQGLFINTSDTFRCDNLILNDINVSNNRKQFISHYGIVNTLTINNLTMSALNKNGAFMYYAKEQNPVIQKVLVNNFNIKDLGSIFITKTPLDLYFTNGVQTGNNVRLHFYNEYLSTFEKTSVTLNAVGGDFTPTWATTSGAKFRINMTSGTYNKDLSSLTPDLFDQVICVSGTEVNRGVNVKNSVGWVKTVSIN